MQKKYFIYFTRLVTVLILCTFLYGCGVQDKAVLLYHKFLDVRTEFEIGKPKEVESVSTDKIGYNLLNDEEKLCYDELYDGVLNFENEFPVSTKDENMIQKVFNLLRDDYGELFWVEGISYKKYLKDDYISGIVVIPTYYMTKSETESIFNKIDSVCDEWLSNIPHDADDYTKSKYVYETLVNNVAYVEGAPDNQNIISVFINKETVCRGYAAASSYMFSKLGIPSLIVSGYSDDESHGWNLIELDGEYYYFDSTWGNSKYKSESDDTTGAYTNYAYLNITTEELLINHEIEMDVTLPECTALQDNYFVREGLIFDEFDKEVVGSKINEAYLRKDSSISIKFKNEDELNTAFDYIITKKQFSNICPGLKKIRYILDERTYCLTLRFNETN